jgi:hypothetical protein
MWQRIQTLYLSISTALIISMFFSRLATIIGSNGNISYVNFVEKIPYLILMISILAANVAALTTFRLRTLQMRVSIIAALLFLGFQVWIAVDYFNAPKGMVFGYTAIFPLIACILDILAARAIFGDELIVESGSHLRAAKRRASGKK